MAGYDIGPRITLKGESEFNNALKKINSSLKEYGSELKVVKSEQEASGKTIETLQKENEVLQKQYDIQVQKLELYRKKIAELVAKQEEQAKAVERATAEFGENSKEVSSAKKAYEGTANEIDKLKVAVNETQAYMNVSQGTIRKNADEIDRLGHVADEAEDDVENLGESAEDASEGFTILKGAAASALGDMFHDLINRAKDAVIDFGKSMIKTAAEVKAENAQFEQTFGDLQSSATEMIEEVAKSTGILDTRLKSSATGMYAFAKASGADSTEALGLMKEGLQAAADTAAYYDKSLEDSTETLQSFLKGNFANDAALGVSCTETTRNAKAMELFGQKYNDLSEVQKQQTLLKMVTDAQKASGAFGQAAREMDGLENVTGNLDEAWRQFQAEVGTPFLEAMIPVIQQLTEKFMEWKDSIDGDQFSSVVQGFADIVVDFLGWVVDNGGTIIAVLSGIGTGFAVFKTLNFISDLASKFQAFWGVIQSGQGIMAALNAVMAANPFGAVAVVIGVLIAAFTALYTNCEWFRDGVNKVFGAVGSFFKTIFGDMVNWLTVTIPQSFQSFGDSWKKGWENLFGNISQKWNDFWNSCQDKLNNIISFVQQNWQGLLLLLVNPFAGAFKLLYDNCDGFRNFIDTWVNKIKNCITGVFGGMWNKAKNWGSDLIAGFVAGIQEKISWLTDSINGVANFISKYLHFSVPDEGPLSDFDESGGDMMQLLIDGINSKKKALMDAVKGIAEGIDSEMNVVYGGAGNLTVSMPIYLDGRKIQQSVNRVSIGNADALSIARGGF